MEPKPFTIETALPAADAAPFLEVRITGYLDAHTVDTFEHAVEEMLALPYHKIILDLGELLYISSAGIGALMVFLQQLRRREGDIAIVQPSPKVYKVFDLLGFTRIFKIVPDYAAARQTLGA